MATSDRLFEVLGDAVARQVVLALGRSDRATQADLVAALSLSQSTVSRALERLRLAGLLDAASPGRGQILELRERDEIFRALSAVDRLAESLLKLDLNEQESRSAETRKAAIRPVRDERRASR